MRRLFYLLFLFVFLSCNRQTEKIQNLQERIDNLEKEMSKTYKPGFGELMSGIQAHHSKLWFAGKYQNWELAAFEVKEINEILSDILIYQKDRKETEKMKMIVPSLRKVSKAVAQQNLDLFVKNYTLLTADCNACHRVTNFDFNKVQVPEESPFTNQDFK